MSRRKWINLSVISLSLLALTAAPAAAWGPAVHAYVADHIGKTWPFLNRIEVYGAVLPDVCYFAYGLEPEEQAICASVVHEPWGPWEAAYDFQEKALGFGYASHNNDWGADHTAHHPLWGYIVSRARLMAVLLKQDPFLGTLPFKTREAIAHTILEASTDVLVKRIDPAIGDKLAQAAGDRGPWVPFYVADVYGKPGLVGLEYFFQSVMEQYGQALAQPSEIETIEDLAEMFAPFVSFWIPGELPPNFDPEAAIFQLISTGIEMTEGDFPPMLQWTTKKVRWSLWLHGVWY